MLCCDTRRSTPGGRRGDAASDGAHATALVVRTHDCAAAWIIELAGCATAGHADTLADTFDRVAERRPALAIVDLTRVTHLAAAAIGMLIRFRNHMAARNADVVLVTASPLIARQLRLLRLHRLFDIQFADPTHDDSNDNAAPPTPDRALARCA